MIIVLPDGHIPCGEAADLVGVNGDAFAVMGATVGMLRKAGNSAPVIDAYRVEAMSGDYDHLIAASMTYIEGAPCPTTS